MQEEYGVIGIIGYESFFEKLSPYTPDCLQMPMYKGIDDGV